MKKKGVANVQEALEGARDIIAENISDEADYRSWIRKQTMQKGHIISSAKDEKAESVYENYYEFDEPVNRLAGYRTLALNRGEKEKFTDRENRGTAGGHSPVSGKEKLSMVKT